ncbi:hypothetical protein [Synechococcus sp. H70.2]|uniref:hypothetical protein n=1 Tax=Synechococcus sp. H70.2 TaxID=2964528 RepID=UPI0039C29C94
MAACFPDELIEAIAQEIHPWAIAVQWQPEFNFEEAQPFCLFQGKQHCSFCRAWLALKQCLRLPRDPVLLQKTWRLIPRDSWGEPLLCFAQCPPKEGL